MGKITCKPLQKAYSNRLLKSVLFIVLLVSIGKLFMAYVNNENGTQTTNFVGIPLVVPPQIPEKLSFAGESVPLTLFYVKESLDRELISNTYFHSQTFSFIKKAPRFLPLVEQILEEEGIPDDFKYLPFIESSYSNVVSPAGAAGYWQFLKGTAADYGLEVSKYIDERYHFEKSTRAACRFLKESYERYGNWTLAAASYNMGRRRLSEAIEEQMADSYYQLYLNEETSRYVFRIIAVKLILENPNKYGFSVKAEEKYQAMYGKPIVVKDEKIDWFTFAREQRVSYKILKLYNPWLINNHLNNPEGKEYIITLPE